MKSGHELPAGTVVAISTGEYSDYRVGAFVKLLKPINEAVWEEMGKACSAPRSYDPDGDPRFDEYKAIPWLVAHGYAEEIEHVELHMGDYGRLASWSEA
jgi:hypothetical protein